MIRRNAVAVALLAAGWLAAAPALGEWRLLGTRQVKRSADRDEIPVTAARGGFKRIKLAVAGSDIEIKDLHVIYGNGEPDKLSVRENIRAGGETRAIDLRGWDRVIKKVVLWYHTERGVKARATVSVWGWD